MREFSSYGPIDPRQHFHVPRAALVEQCVRELAGDADSGGHFVTLWGPRQTGKTWIMRRARDEIRARLGDQLTVVVMTLQGLMVPGDPVEVFFRGIQQSWKEAIGKVVPPLTSWGDWLKLFDKDGGLFDRPVILFIDEFDSLSPEVIDRLIGLFRQMYLTRDAYRLHGLALVGVRAVLGTDTQRGSPFNIQRSLHVPNLTADEVREMYAQYQRESGQSIDPAVVDQIIAVTRGQPGLVSWFGELLTQKYNPDRAAPISMREWSRTYAAACRVEPNNTILNLLSKARGQHVDHVVRLFSQSDVPFSFDQPWCSYLYLNGIIDHEECAAPDGQPISVCRFSSPFIQLRLFNAFSDELVSAASVPAVDLRDDLSDVFAAARLDVPRLLSRYRGYLSRLRAAGIDPWKDVPRRMDLHITEAAGHFHLFAWLQEVLRRRATVLPEFPTGNGKVDLVVRHQGEEHVIEVKSLRQRSDLPEHRAQAARYARARGLSSVTLAVFVPALDEDLLGELSGVERSGDIEVTTIAFG